MTNRYLAPIFFLFLFQLTLRSQEFVVGSVVPCDPAAKATFSIKGSWNPPKEFTLTPEILAEPQIIVFSARNGNPSTENLSYLFSSFDLPIDKKALRLNVVSQLSFYANPHTKPIEQWHPHLLTLVYSPKPSVKDNSFIQITAAIPCQVSEEVFRTLFDSKKNQRYLRVTVAIDAKGNLTSFDLPSPDAEALRPTIGETLKQWRFVPARQQGAPVAATLRLPLPFVIGGPLPKAVLSASATAPDGLINSSAAAQPFWLKLHASPFDPAEMDQPLQLLTASPIDLKALPTLGGVQPEKLLATLYPSGLVAKLTVDETGQVKDVALTFTAEKNLDKLLAAALQSWRFSTPHRNGAAHAVALYVQVSIRPENTAGQPLLELYDMEPHCSQELIQDIQLPAGHSLRQDSTRLATKNVDQTLVDQSRIAKDNPYAATLPDGTVPSDRPNNIFNEDFRSRQSSVCRIHGTVDLSFIVDTNGNVTDPVVLKSAACAYEAPAIQAVLHRKYVPFKKAGVLQPIKVKDSIFFGGQVPLGVQAAPMEFQILQPPDLPHATTVTLATIAQPIYPRNLMDKKQEGYAVANVQLDAKGNTLGIEIVEASQPEFGLALQASLEASAFKPVTNAGIPVASTVQRKEDFKLPGLVLGKPSQSLFLLLNPDDETPVDEKNLDRPLKAVVQHQAVYPLSLRSNSTSGEATIEFIVNKEGLVCAPRILSASEPAFGFAAVQAVSSWGFEAPQKNDRPVAAKTTVTVRFIQGAHPIASSTN